MNTPLPVALNLALTALIEVGKVLRARIAAALAHTTPLPRPFRRNPASAEAHVAKTLEWLAALARTLAGDPYFRRPITYLFPRFPGRYPSLTNAIRVSWGLPPNPPATLAQRAARRLRYMRDVFATQSTGLIAGRLARRLGLAPNTPTWPADLVAITETPAAYGAGQKKAGGFTPAPKLGAAPPDPHSLVLPIVPHPRE